MPLPKEDLASRIRRAIAATGPISLAEYMHICLADPQGGYYARKPAIGAKGDFVTAPHVSQMFGELIGIWCASVWLALGSPRRFSLVEAGPGHGTMMVDLLRAGKTVPGFADAAQVMLIETSPAMIEIQADNLNHAGRDAHWISSLDALETSPIILVANEFLDALPVRQFVRTESAWLERCVDAEADGRLKWAYAARIADSSILPAGASAAPVGSVFEYAPARNAWVSQLATLLTEGTGAALLVDYGYAGNSFGDTFQAVQEHDFADPLAAPGEADLTAHVDFAAAGAAAAAAGAAISPVVTQGHFLGAMGLAGRATRLAEGKAPAVQRQIAADAQRLANPAEMGEIFKLIALSDRESIMQFQNIPPFSMAAND
jgi:NADH dehydrogenase [ubiquinone] 1 alpha subcomplex assembly factor 7